MKGSLRSYAKHRKDLGLPGGSLASVQKALKTQRISACSDGQIEFETADRSWSEKTNQSQQRFGDSPVVSPAVTLDRGFAYTDIAAELNTGDTFQEAQRQKEWIRVKRDALELRRKEGEVVPLAEINAWCAGMVIRAREVLIRIAPELKDRLAQETDPIRCEKLIAGEINRALNELAEYKPQGS
jgi:hypothetical protein